MVEAIKIHRSLVVAIALPLVGARTRNAFVTTRRVLFDTKNSVIPFQNPLESQSPRIHRLHRALDLDPVTSEPDDTIRVRIWRALSSSYGKEITLKELGTIVGERSVGDLRSHLLHVEKQAKTLKNKSLEWRERRGLSNVGIKRGDKIRVRIRRGKKNEITVKLE